MPDPNGLAYPLKTYKFAEGWKHYEYRWIIEPESMKTSSKPSWWNGELNKKVLWREQGIGDDILF